MLFQTLDDKAECVGIYFNNQLLFDSNNFPQELSGTWSYSPYLRDFDVDYASLYLEGKPLSDNIPEFLQDDWNDVSQKILAFKRSLEISKVNQDENCFFDLVPHRFLKDFCEVKNSVTKHIFDTLPRPTRYEFYKHVSMLLGDISCHKINIDKRKVSSFIANKKLENSVKSILTGSPYVRYNQFGTVTGRLTTRKNSFPILTLNKSLRTAIKPTNDYFVELDYNGAEVRTLLGMLGSEQPLNDVHEFHLSNVFGGNVTREQSKILFFSWLYGSKKMSNSAEGVKLENFYDRIKILEKYYTNSTVTTPYGKVIKDVAPRLALNYLVQSTTAELTLKQALKIDYLLRNKGTGSRIAFLIHDAIVLDVKKDDKHLLPLVKKLMASTNFGKFMINTKIGYSLGSMMREKIG
tara:strand:+ start:8287 stop:9507 length:1221 start_codon:yes stop_codon:yes gene_type:complete